MAQFDFQEWADLYKVDPEAFENRKEAVLRDFVSRASEPHQKSLEHTLFRIRMASARSKSPLQSALEASKLMWESFGKLREQVELLQTELNAPAGKPTPGKKGSANSLRLISGTEAEQAAELPTSTRLSALDEGHNQAEEQPSVAQILRFNAPRSGKRAH